MARHIYSLHMGRETMMAFTGIVRDSKPNLIAATAEGGEPFGYAVMKDGSLRLGNQLYEMNGNDYSDISSINTDYKEIMSKYSMLLEYAGAWYNRIKERMRIINNSEGYASAPDYSECWVIEIPKECCEIKDGEAYMIGDNRSYQSVFEEAGYKNPMVLPKSNGYVSCADMTYFVNAYGADDVKLADDLLCINFGSHSCSATFFGADGSSCSYEENVGASCVEKAILDMNFKELYRSNPDRYNDPGFLNSVKTKCKGNKRFYEYVLLKVKKLKETYYLKQVQGHDVALDTTVGIRPDSSDVLFSQWSNESFILYINDDMMKSIVNDTIVSNNLSLADCISDFVERAAERVDKNKDTTVILTGGATMMTFVRDIVMDIIPNGIYFAEPSDPIAVTTKGFWHIGSYMFKLNDLEGAYDFLLEAIDSGNKAAIDICADVLGVTYKDAGKLIGIGNKPSIADKSDEFIGNSIRDWLAMNHYSGSIIPVANAAFSDWMLTTLFGQCMGYGSDLEKGIVSELNNRFKEYLKGSPVSDRMAYELGDEELGWFDDFSHAWFDSIFCKFNELFDDEEVQYNEYFRQYTDSIIGVGKKRKAYYNGISQNLDNHRSAWLKKMNMFLEAIGYNDEMNNEFYNLCLSNVKALLEKGKKNISVDLFAKSSDNKKAKEKIISRLKSFDSESLS